MIVPDPTRMDDKRLFDLVRFSRMYLLNHNLISLDEYDELAKEHAAVNRLETYDGLRLAVRRFEEDNERLKDKVIALEMRLLEMTQEQKKPQENA